MEYCSVPLCYFMGLLWSHDFHSLLNKKTKCLESCQLTLFNTILDVWTRIRCSLYTFSHSVAIQVKRDVLNHNAREIPPDELQVLIRFYALHCLLLWSCLMITIVLKEAGCTHGSYWKPTLHSWKQLCAAPSYHCYNNMSIKYLYLHYISR